MQARYWPPKNIFPFRLTKSVFWWSSLVVRCPPKLDATTPIGQTMPNPLSSWVTWSFSCETLFWLNFWIQCESIVFTILPRLWPVLIVAGAEKASPAWVTFYHENFLPISLSLLFKIHWLTFFSIFLMAHETSQLGTVKTAKNPQNQ